MIEPDQQSPEYFEEHAVQTGRVIAAAAYFDDAINTFIARLLDLNEEQDNALLRPMGTRAKVELLARLSKLKLEPSSELKMRAVFNEARAALDDRNALVHGVPGQIDGRFALISWAGKNRMDPRPEPWPVERVCQLAQRLIRLLDLFAEMTTHFDEKSGEESDASTALK